MAINDNRPPKRHPNILIMLVDEERFPSAYENRELLEWRKRNLKTQGLLQQTGMTFLNHYIGSTACSPSRTTLYTGQYPSLHGVTQTTGAAKGSFDPNVFWLDPNTVPTIGDYFRTAGYQTFWKGKWHASDEDLLIPGTHNALLSYHPYTGVPNDEREKRYLNADRLDPYGFSGWIGPEPHGSSPRNSASSAAKGVSGRDVVYAHEVVILIEELEEQSCENDQPWLIVSSFVNPHDITLFGEFTRFLPNFNFELDSTVPFIPPSPTADEDLLTKPSTQASYRDVYQKALQPTLDTLFYRQLYFSLHKQVDDEMFKVYQALKDSIFFEDTIVVFTADHGSLVGSHGGLFQKWHNAYEEALHVPLIVSNPYLFPSPTKTNMLTSHADIVPTLLHIANIDILRAQEQLKQNHTEVHPLVGRDLTPLLRGKKNFSRANEPLYFMTDDEFSKGLNQFTLTGEPYESVIQPNHLESVIVKLPTGHNDEMEIWKYTRYFDNPQFWSNPGVEDVTTAQHGTTQITEEKQASLFITTTKTVPVPDECELYNLTRDPFETINLAHPDHQTRESEIMQRLLNQILKKQRDTKRLSPTNGNSSDMKDGE